MPTRPGAAVRGSETDPEADKSRGCCGYKGLSAALELENRAEAATLGVVGAAGAMGSLAKALPS